MSNFIKEMAKQRRWNKKHPIRAGIIRLKYLPWRLKRILWEEPLMATKHGFQRMFRGYDDTAYWSLYSYITSICIPALKKYKKEKLAYPGSFKNEKEWDKAVDKMIAAFRSIERDDYGLSNKDWRNWRKEYKIQQEGLQLFAKHFRGLWD